MVTRKVWVKRPHASATLVTISQDDLVDDVRDMIIRKYANSIGRTYDAPDVVLRITSRNDSAQYAHRPESDARILSPDEPIFETLDKYYPRGQSVEDALLIDVPPKPTPKSSPRPGQHLAFYNPAGDLRPVEGLTEYFPPMPVTTIPSPRLPGSPSAVTNGIVMQTPHLSSMHSITVLSTGQIPQLPSPGVSRHPARHIGIATGVGRPPYARTHTASPPGGAPGQLPHDASCQTPLAPTLPSPPILDASASDSLPSVPASSVSTISARARASRPYKRLPSSSNAYAQTSNKAPLGVLDGAVPPINVLIVEDNIINLKLLEAFMKRLKVRWQTAMNGREAVDKWRAGGFHLVLMDIQLPVMSGLEATKEIRRLEGQAGRSLVREQGVKGRETISELVNGSGVETAKQSGVNAEVMEDKSQHETYEKEEEEEEEENHMPLFRSPVIIVALTASSLQSDRHEALAAGCNDFLTKPVNFVWLERKVMEWGCMQALIDFDGWRKWKDFSQSKAPLQIGTNKFGTGSGSGDTSGGKKSGTSRSTTSPGQSLKKDGDRGADKDEGQRGSRDSGIQSKAIGEKIDRDISQTNGGRGARMQLRAGVGEESGEILGITAGA